MRRKTGLSRNFRCSSCIPLDHLVPNLGQDLQLEFITQDSRKFCKFGSILLEQRLRNEDHHPPLVFPIFAAGTTYTTIQVPNLEIIFNI